jgi:Rrf2 family protein
MSYSLGFTQAIGIMISIGAQVLFKQKEWVSSLMLSETLGIPRPTVANLLSRLLSAGLVESKEGVQGGVRLAKPAEQISLLDIFQAIEQKKPLFRTDFRAIQNTPESSIAREKVLKSFSMVEENLKNTLASVRLSDLFGCDMP